MAEAALARFRSTRRSDAESYAPHALARALVLLSILLLVLSAGQRRAHAQTAPRDASSAEARRLLDLANAAFEARRYSEAATRFDASVALRPNAVATFIAAVSWDEAKEPQRAADDYARALTVEGLDPRRTATARTRLAELEQALGTAVVITPRGWRVSLDGGRAVTIPARLHAPPGSHTLVATPIDGKSGSEETRTLDLVIGRPRFVSFGSAARESPPEPTSASVAAIAPTEGETAPPPPESHGWPASRTVGVVTMTLGVLTVTGAVVLGLRVLDERDAYYASPSRQTFDQTRTLETATTACWIAGGGLIAAGAAIALLPELWRSSDKSGSVAVVSTGRGFALRGEF